MNYRGRSLTNLPYKGTTFKMSIKIKNEKKEDEKMQYQISRLNQNATPTVAKESIK